MPVNGCVCKNRFLGIRCTARYNEELLDLGGIFCMRTPADDVPERKRHLL